MTRRFIEIEFHSAFHHGSGYGLAGVVDRAVLRDCDGLPLLAGSAIKGKLRFGTLRVLLAEEQKACQYADDRAVCRGPNCCMLCRLFGSPIKKGELMFGDAYPSGQTGELIARMLPVAKAGVYYRDSSVRFGTGISRAVRCVRPQLLFSSETLPESLVFRGPVIGDMSSDEQRVLEEACRALTHFGASGARGLGRCTYQLKGEA